MANEKTKLDRIDQAILQTTLEMSSEELRQHFHEQGEDPEDIVSQHRKMVANAIARSRRSRLNEARTALDADRQDSRTTNMPTTASARKAALVRLLSSPNAPQTLAARSGTGAEMTDEEVSSLLEDLRELGLEDGKD